MLAPSENPLFVFLFVSLLGVLAFLVVDRPESIVYEEQEKLVLRENEHYLSYVPDAEYTIVEYFDFDCVFCRRLYIEPEKKSIDYSGVNYIVRSFPVTDITLSAYKSLIAECIYLQSGDVGYLAFMDGYFTEWGSKVQFDWVLALAEQLVADEFAFDACIASNQDLKNSISTQYGLDAVSGIYNTPTFVVYKNGVLEEVYRGLGIKLYVSLISYYSR